MAEVVPGPEQRPGLVVPAAMSLLAAHPRLVPTELELAGAHHALQRAYDDYTRNVSPHTMAVSFETATFAYCLAKRIDAKTACDFGSGFTSYTLRVAVPSVVSVDDSPEWLGWTGKFLERYDQTSGLLVEWGEFDHGPFDLIVYDFGKGEFREEHMGFALDLLNPGGLCLFDDAQHHTHQPRMLAECRLRRFDLFDVSEWTRDSQQRFAALAVRP